MAKKSEDTKKEQLFEETLVSAKPGSSRLFDVSYGDAKSKPVECLGRKFPNDEARRAYFTEKLRKKLNDAEFRKIEGFPIGSDEDILALSDPPYYTVCPNPFISEFVQQFGKQAEANGEKYQREPFAADVSEGKNDPIYNAHSYHTKVPHKAIMRYILQYTEPGDIVFDGFCGTGMTGVAAQLCGSDLEVSKLGYSIATDGTLTDATGANVGTFGSRVAILNDLSPAATLIAAGYNRTDHVERFPDIATKLLNRFYSDYGWMYETTDPRTGQQCPIEFTVWSEIFSCPQCSGEIEFWSLAYDEESGKIAGLSKCPHCKAEVGKRDLNRAMTTYSDPALKTTRKRQLLRPVLIEYKSNGKSIQKLPDQKDLETVAKVEGLLPTLSYPTDLMMFIEEGKEWGDLYRGYHEAMVRVHDFHLPRQLVALSLLWSMGDTLEDIEFKRLWKFVIQSVMVSFTRRNRFLKNAFSQVNRSLSGTLYVGSTVSEPTPEYVLSGKIKRFAKAIPHAISPVLITTQSLASVAIPENSIDYVFIDPPFGDNLPYSELNFLWEAWLKVISNATTEATVNSTQNRDILSYSEVMTRCLENVYRVLKPGRWVTVEFHNSQNRVWTAIQEALGRAGFIIADVRVLDKGMLTKKQLHANAVNKDLVISAYKPTLALEESFRLEAGTEQGVWDFLSTHLGKLPLFVIKDGKVEIIVERQHFLLFDRMVAFHVQRGVSIPLSATEFYEGLRKRHSERDGMFFLNEQAQVYDRKRLTVNDVEQLELFVSDEKSARHWVRVQLAQEPRKYQALQPLYMREAQKVWEKHEEPIELMTILSQGFIKDDSDRWQVPDPKNEAHLEQLRNRDLLREYQHYFENKGKMKVVRTEALRAGFKDSWQKKDYATIVQMAKRVPEAVIQEDESLLMYFDNATLLLGE